MDPARKAAAELAEDTAKSLLAVSQAIERHGSDFPSATLAEIAGTLDALADSLAILAHQQLKLDDPPRDGSCGDR